MSEDAKVFTRPLPAAVTYDLSDPEAVIRLPVGSTWTSGPHWHATHTEFLQVISGYAQVTLAGRLLASVGSEQGVLTVPRGTIHEWRRSTVKGLGDELVVREWTDPKDGQKALFFTSLNRRILEAIRAGEGSWAMRTLDLQLFNIFWRLDNYPTFLASHRPGWLQGLVTQTALTGAVALGWILGCKGVYS